MDKPYIGVIEDPRPDVEKSKDWKASDLFGAPAPVWIEKGKDGWTKPYLIRNQDGSSQCMAFAGAKQLGVNEKIENGSFVNLSPTFIYRKRNHGGLGMWMQDLLSIMVNHGSPKDEWFPCDNLNEAQIELAPTPSPEVVKEALKYKGKGYAQTPEFNIDRIAQAIDIAGSSVIIIRCNIKEWTPFPFVDLSIRDWIDWDVNHGILATEYGLINGVKYLKIEDSWGSFYGKNGERWLSEDFISKRMFGGGYVIDQENLPVTQKFYFSKDLKKDMVSEDVKNLQRVLILEGCMTIAEANTGWSIFGNKTFNAVIRLQEKYAKEILHPVGLTKGTGYVGTATRNFLNKKWG
jgi:hypothetical protein